MIAITGKNERQCLVEVFDGQHNLIFQRMVNQLNPAEVEWLAGYTKWKIADVYSKLASLIQQRSTESFEFNADEEPAPPFTITIREIYGTTKEFFPGETPLEALTLAFNFAKTNQYKEPVLSWTDDRQLACLDIDYHDSTPPTISERESLIARLKPAPVAWHPSHGSGLKLFYTSTNELSAIEVAGIAQYFYSRLDKNATFDRIKETRHPSFGRTRDGMPACANSLTLTYAQVDISALQSLLMGEPSVDDIECFLGQKGWIIGQSLPHSLCPIDPSESLKENVFIGDKGVFCHRCKARGLRGGFMSWASLIESNPPVLSGMLSNLVHFDHASIILAKIFRTSENVTRDIYRAMLKLMHGIDSRINQVFNNGKGFIRIRGQWVTKDGSTVLTQNLNKFAQSLPAAKTKVGDKISLDVSKATALMNAGDISNLGYHPITFIRGCKIFSHHLNIDDNFHVIIRPEFRSHPPRYLIESKRMPEEEAWEMIEDIFPKLDRNYVKLLIAAKGSSEGRSSQCPYILVSGPSGAGKSTIVHIAASICGDKAEEPLWVPDTIRFRQSLMDAARNADFLCINEIFKESIRNKLTPVQALNPLLSLTEDSRSHAMYVGSVPFGRLPVIVLTDIDVPPEIETDIQLSRRLILHRLNSRTYWEKSLAERQIRPGMIRTISTAYARACDTILSVIIDSYFKYPRPLSDIAKDIGIGMGNETEKVDCIKQNLLNLFNLVKSAPELTGSHKDRYYAPGWKLIDRNVDSPLLEAWNDIADMEQWGQSRAIQSTDWQEILGTSFPVKCQANAFRKRYVYIRFRDASTKLEPFWINGAKNEN